MDSGEFKHSTHVRWVECTTGHNMIAALMQWIDDCRGLFFESESAPNLGLNWIVRTLDIHFVTPQWLCLQPHQKVSISARITKLGNSSFVMEHQVYAKRNNLEHEELTVFATAAGAVVLVDDKWQKRNFTARERTLAEKMLKSSYQSDKDLSKVNGDGFQRINSDNESRYHMFARPSDEDGVGHINNTFYSRYCFDALVYHLQSAENKNLGKNLDWGLGRHLYFRSMLIDFQKALYAGDRCTCVVNQQNNTAVVEILNSQKQVACKIISDFVLKDRSRL